MKQRTELKKTLKPHWIWAVSFGTSVGWGAFVLPGDWLLQAGPIGTTIGFGIGALLILLVATSYNLFIRKYQVSGGEFAYTYIRYGRTHAFIVGWLLTLGYTCIVALNATALSLLVKFIFPDIIRTGYMYSIAGWDVYFTEIVFAGIALAFIVLLNIRGSGLSGKTQFVFCVILALTAILLSIGMFAHPDTSIENLKPAFKPGASFWPTVLFMVSLAPWALSGFDNIPQMSEELDFSPKKVYRLIVYAVFTAALVYILITLSTAVAMPWQDLVNSHPIWATGDAVRSKFGSVGILILAISLAMGIATGMNGFIVSSSRLLFAMSRAKVLPGFFSKLHAKSGTPYFSIIFIGALCFVFPWLGREVLNWIIPMSSISLAVAFFYVCSAAFSIYKWKSPNKNQSSEIVSPTKKY